MRCKEKVSDLYGTYKSLETKLLNTSIIVSKNEELIFESQNLSIANTIYLKENSKLIFEHCHIHLDEKSLLESTSSRKPIVVEGNSKISLHNCTIELHSANLALIYAFADTKLSLNRCLVKGYSTLIEDFEESAISVSMDHCKVLIPEKIESSPCLGLAECNDFHAKNVSFDQNNSKHGSFYRHLIDLSKDGTAIFENCEFYGLNGCSLSSNSLFTYATFDKCQLEFSGAYEKYGTGMITNTTFKRCTFIDNPAPISRFNKIKLINCMLIDCIGEIPAYYLEKVIGKGGKLTINCSDTFTMKESELAICISSIDTFQNIKTFLLN